MTISNLSDWRFARRPLLHSIHHEVKYKIKLEIWGRAQREAARRRKSDWNDNTEG